MIPTHLTTFHKICVSNDISHECWNELRVFFTVVVAWDATPHSSAGRHQLFGETCLRFKDRNDFTSQNTAGVGVAVLNAC